MTDPGKSATVSIIRDRTLSYPEGEDYFSPDQAYPEYRSKHLSKKPNGAYRALRQCLAQAGLDKENFGKAGWNPLRDYILPGQKVFVLCNFVQHNFRRDPEIALAKCTHGSVVRAVIDYVLLALNGRGAVYFGNAPLQSCDWDKMIEETGARKVREFYREFGGAEVRVELRDLRQQITRRNALGGARTRLEGEDADFWVPVDLGADSLLEELYRTGMEPRLRVLDYDPRRTEGCHGRGRHVYLPSKQVLECDVVVSVPKLKTHEKVGITCGIKGCVGSIAQKDCLAHHRRGPPRAGGDEYPDALSFLRPFSALHDAVYSREAGSVQSALHLLNHNSRKVIRRFTRTLSGSWPGNDTCWRMALDIARIVEHANKEGRLQREKQRTHLMFTDGIVGGEGDGPLSPQPVRLGYLSFSDNVAMGDYVNCVAMGFAPEKIPLIREAFRVDSYRLTEAGSFEAAIHLNGDRINIGRLGDCGGRKFLAPREWRGHL